MTLSPKMLTPSGAVIAAGTYTLKKVAKKKGKGGAIGALGLVGRGIGALALPVVGGVMSLVGGAMSLTGGVISAGSAITGIASSAASGVMGAAGGLGGKGRSGNVKSSNQKQMVQNALNKKGPTGKSKGGLANVKSMLQPSLSEGLTPGASSDLTTGEETQKGLLSQILDQTRTNTIALFSIDEKMGGLLALGSVPLVDQAKELKGDNDNDKEPGVVRKTFGFLGDKLKSLSSSLAGGAGSIIKGIGLAGLLYVFTKYRKQIVGMVAGIFETLEGFFTGLSTGDDPLTNMFATVKNYFNESVLPTIKSVLISALEMLYMAVASIVNTILPGFMSIPTTMDLGSALGGASVSSYDSTSDVGLTTLGNSVGGAENLGNVKTGVFNGMKSGDIKFSDLGGKDMVENEAIRKFATDKLNMMWENFSQSGGRIQWTNIKSGFSKTGTLPNKVSIQDIMTSKPIVDGFLREVNDLNNPNLLSLPAFTNKNFEADFISNLVSSTGDKQSILMKNRQGLPSGYFESTFEGRINNRKNLLLSEGEFQKQTGQVVFAGGSETNYNSKTEVNGQSSVQSTDLNLNKFFGGGVPE